MNETDTLAPAADAGDLPPFRDDDGSVSDTFRDLVTGAVLAADVPVLRVLVEDLHETDLADLLEALDSDDRPKLISLLGRDFDFAALTELDDTVREEILDELPNQTIAEGVADLETDDAVYIIEDLEKEDQDEVLANLPAIDRAALRRSLDYPEGSAGRLMLVDFIAVPPFWTVGQTIDHCRESDDLPDNFFEIFVVDPAHKLVGTLPLDKLLRTKRPVVVEDLMEEVEHRIHAVDDAGDAALLFQRYNLVSAPVLDESDRLVGVLTVDDMVDVIGEEADAEIRALGGVGSEEELSDTVPMITRSRFPWLLANLVTALLSATVISMFESSLEKMVALAVLMPVVASMGGNAGTQTMTVAVRALATREIGRANAWRIIRREVMVGFLNGIAFAIILGVVAALWFGQSDIGFVIGMAIVTVLTVAGLGGILIPLALNKLGADPAVASGPFVTTVTDVVGFFAFLGIATLWFGLWR